VLIELEAAALIHCGTSCGELDTPLQPPTTQPGSGGTAPALAGGFRPEFPQIGGETLKLPGFRLLFSPGTSAALGLVIGERKTPSCAAKVIHR